jgi:hypothetical protein
MSIERVRIKSSDFRDRMCPWVLSHPEAEGKSITHPVIEHLTRKLGLVYVDSEHCFVNGVYYVFNIIDKPLFMLARIKLGI